MKLRYACAGLLTALCIATVAWAGSDDTYVSGLLHMPLGTAQLGPVEGRKLEVHNLGSSGEDGVEVRMDSAFGGDVAVDVEALLSTAGATLRHKHKGWDGLIYGNHALVSHGDGTGTITFDFSGMGAVELRVVEYGDDGTVISDEVSVGPIAAKPVVPPFTCPGGGTPILVSGWRRVCPTCPWFYWYGWACLGGDYPQEYTFESARVVVTPTVAPGTPEPGGIESTLVTASDIPELFVADATLATFGLHSWGTGQAQIGEQCVDPVDCTAETRDLYAGNLGSSGEDGVSIALGPDVGGVTIGLAKGNCCRGHVIIMKLYDDEGQEQRISRTQIDDLEPLEELDADFSSLGAIGFVLTLYDSEGGVLGPPEGTAFISGGAKPVWTNRCPPGAVEIWVNEGTTSNPVWVFQGCQSYFDFVLPGYGTVTDVASFRIEPLDATSSAGRLTRCVLTSDDDEGILIDSFTVLPLIPGDLNCDGEAGFDDINPFVLALSNPAAYAAAFPGCNILTGDCNGDGVVDFKDINPFVAILAGG